jgi:O-antigen ligase
VPEGWTIAGYFSPYEDISSFGSLAVAVFLFFVATLGPGSRTRLFLQITFCFLLAVMVIASFSRATWLAAGVFLLVVAWRRLPKKILAAFFAIAVVCVFAVNANVNNPRWRENPYWVRLVALVRFENPLNKDAGRINLYYKGMGMMQSRPLVGHGIGSFYLTSTLYPNRSDPFGDRPDFAHDIFLQVATELGIPVALVFAALCVFVLYFAWTHLKSSRTPSERRAPSGNVAHPEIVNLPLLGTAIALSAYLTTQLTANSLNVYVSNQLFCWFLAAINVDYVTRGCPRIQP